MSRRSSVRGDVLHVKTGMGLGRFEVVKSRNSYDVPFRSYSIAFEKKQKLRSWPMRVEHYGRKFSHSYDVPFRSCLGNSWCRAVNSIPKAKLYLNVSRITQFTRNQVETILAIQTHFHWATSLMGVIFPPSCRPSSSWL